MSRLQNTLAELKAAGRKALIPYITAGDPDLDTTLQLMHDLVAAGADIIELGVPFSDPMADGPTIQLAYERALLHNVGLRDVLALVERFRSHDNKTPVVLMGYMNPIEYMGYETFVSSSVQAGVDGVLVVDLPPEECETLTAMLHEQNLDTIFLLTPTTSDQRAAEICRHSSGYVYYVSIKGVTGANTLDVTDVKRHVDRLRRATDLPIAVGFGIKTADDAAAVSRVADGVIVGSALVNIIARSGQGDTAVEISSQVSALVSDMRKGMDAA
ncbi:MAG: tryptophan synthase subunit alpha [Natronospirillum sp.]|uniref:tryptophan synthase subunit alpha n=1 Tax=Natronospirillum sp. TaxID=2812955 RepID=UPI0025D15F1C|nr:tryptophan synthase subunit alpha [Natronospirillum sp.]MCH8551367.1 tryptophan synthase subunit alpha [Natronospirillum sp.]